MTRLKGIASLIVAIAIVVGFILWIPALKYFLLGAFVIGVIVVFILRAWYARKPVKSADEEQIKLHLND